VELLTYIKGLPVVGPLLDKIDSEKDYLLNNMNGNNTNGNNTNGNNTNGNNTNGNNTNGKNTNTNNTEKS
jgi:hypothetical protein